MKLIILMVVALVLTGCDYFAPTCAENATSAKANAEAESVKATAASQIEFQKRLVAIQLDVSKRCADKGNIPVYFNGNIDCKIAPK